MRDLTSKRDELLGYYIGRQYIKSISHFKKIFKNNNYAYAYISLCNITNNDFNIN